MDTEFIRDSIGYDRCFADMQTSIVKELREIKADILTGKGISKLDRLIEELEKDAETTYNRLEVLRNGN